LCCGTVDAREKIEQTQYDDRYTIQPHRFFARVLLARIYHSTRLSQRLEIQWRCAQRAPTQKLGRRIRLAEISPLLDSRQLLCDLADH
jgi:hypothetical protein